MTLSHLLTGAALAQARAPAPAGGRCTARSAARPLHCQISALRPPAAQPRRSATAAGTMDGEGLSPFFGIESAPSLKLTGNEAFQDARLAKVEALPDEECYDDMHGAPSVPRLFW